MQRAFPSPHESQFVCGLKLELSGMVADAPNDCHLATVTQLYGVHVRLALDGCVQEHESVIRVLDSPDLHPLGCAASNGGQVVPPKG